MCKALFPYIIFELEHMFLRNDIKVLYKKESIYAYLGVISVFVGSVFMLQAARRAAVAIAESNI